MIKISKVSTIILPNFCAQLVNAVALGREGYDYVIRLNKKHKEYPVMREMFKAWYDEAQRSYKGDYNDWRYNFSRDEK